VVTELTKQEHEKLKKHIREIERKLTDIECQFKMGVDNTKAQLKDAVLEAASKAGCRWYQDLAICATHGTPSTHQRSETRSQSKDIRYG
jgi:hypothetical protein